MKRTRKFLIMCVSALLAVSAAVSAAPEAWCKQCPPGTPEDAVCATDRRGEARNFASQCAVSRANCLTSSRYAYRVTGRGLCATSQVLQKHSKLLPGADTRNETLYNWKPRGHYELAKVQAKGGGKIVNLLTKGGEMLTQWQAMNDTEKQKQVASLMSKAPDMLEGMKEGLGGKGGDIMGNLLTKGGEMLTKWQAMNDKEKQKQVASLMSKAPDMLEGMKKGLGGKRGDIMGNLLTKGGEMVTKWQAMNDTEKHKQVARFISIEPVGNK